MKIAQVVCVYPPYAGGIGIASQKLQKTLLPKHESFVFTSQHKDGYSNNDQKENIIRLKPLLKLGHGAVLFSLLKKLKSFDVIYFHYPFFGTAIIIWLFKILNPKKRLIIHYHMDVHHKNIFFKILSWPEEIIKKSLFKKSENIVSASFDYIKNSNIKNIYNKYPNKFREIPFSVDTNTFKPGKKSSENTILFVGGLDKAHYFKGVDILIKAVSEIKDLSWKLKIVGDGELKNNLKDLTKNLKIEDRIIFSGKLEKEDFIKSFQEAKMLVLPSINSNEAFGIVLIEAMACGTPVIASNLPGVRTVFENEKSGLMVKPKDIEDLKNKIKTILQNPEKLENMSSEAHKLVLEKYSEEIINDKVLELFK
ncbi:MAG: glycosyltransferase family 4 protein [Patescibacteria group bacterium]|nr:glycosyltransferase family 4 protein [Patescibacteria group bacterium]